MLCALLFLFSGQEFEEPNIRNESEIPSLVVPLSSAEGDFEYQTQWLTQTLGYVDTDLLRNDQDGGVNQLAFSVDGQDFILNRTEWIESWGGYLWRGEVFGVEPSEALFSVVGDSVWATIQVDTKIYRLRPLPAQVGAQGMHAFGEIDLSHRCGCEPIHLPAPIPAVNGRHRSSGSTAAIGNPTIDVFVVWTQAAGLEAGGPLGIRSRINLDVQEANDAYLNSDVTQRIHVVTGYQIPGYTESTNNDVRDEVYRLENTSDGYLDAIPDDREKYGADCVVMYSKVGDPNRCGAAIQMSRPLIESHESRAYAVLDLGSTSTNCVYTFVHELGHVMGCTHDISYSFGRNEGAYQFAAGYETTNQMWRTLMHTGSAGASSTPIKYFSNPNKTYAGSFLGSTQIAENWLCLNGTAPTIAEWHNPHDLNLTLTLPWVAGSNGIAKVTGTGQLFFDVYLFAGPGTGRTSDLGLGLNWDLVSPRQLAVQRSNFWGRVTFDLPIPARYMGMTAFLQAGDSAQQLSQVRKVTIQ